MAAVYGFVDTSKPGYEADDAKAPLRMRLEHIIEVSNSYPSSAACSILAHAARIELQSQ
jgi:hypothetical protein